jgi:hypothetical protein
MLSYKPKDISRTGPTHVVTSGRLIIWLPMQPNNFVPLKTSNFFWSRIELVNLSEGSCSNCAQFWKNYFAYGNWRLLQSYLWLLQWCCLLPLYLLLFQWCLSTPGSCLAHPLLSPALDNLQHTDLYQCYRSCSKKEHKRYCMSTLISERKKTAHILQIFFEISVYFTVIFGLSMMFLQQCVSYFCMISWGT